MNPMRALRLSSTPGDAACFAARMTLLSFAVVAALMGAALYAWQRPHAALFVPTAWHQPLAPVLPPEVLGAAPTLLHVLALSLATVAFLRVASRRAIGRACGAWVGADVAIELLQHPWPLLPAVLPRLPGTFDRLDLCAALVGGALAALIATGVHRLSASNRRRRSPWAVVNPH